MTLQTLVTNYVQPAAVRELIESSRIALLVGISGAGKDTTKRALLKHPDFAAIVSYTTRAPRQNNGSPEQEGVDYYFIDEARATSMLERQEFIEAKFVHGTMYGTSTAELQKIQQTGTIAVTDVDVQGVAEYKKVSQNVVAIFILPPDYDTWRDRLRKRYATQTEFAAEWPKRSATAIVELKEALSVPYYHFIINHEIDRTVAIADEFAHIGNMYNRKDTEARAAAFQLLESIQAHS